MFTSFYALTVLDKAVGKQNLDTLYGLVIIFIIIYFFIHAITVAKSFVLTKTGEWLEIHVSEILFRNSIEAVSQQKSTNTQKIMYDFMVIRRFITGNALSNIIDAPFSPIYLIATFSFNTRIGMLAVFAMIMSVLLGLFNTYITYSSATESQQHRQEAQEKAQIANYNAETIYAMGMMNNVLNDWRTSQTQYMKHNLTATFRGTFMSQFMSFFRQGIIQIYVTFLGAYTVITQALGPAGTFTTGGMITCSILVGKALKPFDSFIVTYDEVNNARSAYTGINLSFFEVTEKRTVAIENVRGQIEIDNVFFSVASTANPLAALFGGAKPKEILKGVSMTINEGEVVAILGASAAGKTTLAKLITGLWQPTSGSVTLDGFETATWQREDFGRHIGYLAQDVQLFQGTVSQNIARMDPNYKSSDVIAAAKAARAHDVILRMQKAYDQDIGKRGMSISGGQRQRVGLARAFYGNPKFILLDEPNSALDVRGLMDLRDSILEAKSKGITVIVITHRTEILESVDRVAYLEDGKLIFYDNLPKFKLFMEEQSKK